MSTIDLSNPQVLRNYLMARMKEGKGKFYEKKDCIVFRDEAGNEVVAPADVVEYVKVKKERASAAKAKKEAAKGIKTYKE